MPQLVRFDQEPGAPNGMGTFHFDDGRSLFAHDPETASSLSDMSAQAFGGPDMRTAQNGFQTTDQRLDAGGPAPGLDDQLQAMNFQGPAGGAPAPPPQPAAQAPAVGGGPGPEARAAPPDPQAEAMKFITAPVRVAPTRGGVIPKTQSQTVEQEGLPYDPALAEQRADANINMMVARRNTAETLATRAQAESLHAQAQIPELQKQAAQAQTEVEEQHNQYKRERADLDRMILESQQNQKSFNANRWFESRGAIGQIGAVLAQAVGAYAAVLGHTENWAQKIINQYIDADIATQREQIESGKAGVNNALQRLNLRYGDINQAQAALKIAMGKVADTQALAYAKATGSQDIINTWEEQVAKNQVERTAEEQKFQAAAMGKRTTATQGQVVAPSAGGVRAPTTAEMSARADLAGKIPGIATKTYEAESARQKAMGGGVDPEKARDEARNLSKDTAEIVKGQAEAQAGRELVQKYKGADSIPGLGLGADVAAAIPFGIGQRVFSNEEARHNRAIINRTVLAYQHALTGAGASEKERDMLSASILGAKTPQELSEAIEQADEALAARRRHAESGFDPSVVEQAKRRGAYQPTVAPKSLQREDQP